MLVVEPETVREQQVAEAGHVLTGGRNVLARLAVLDDGRSSAERQSPQAGIVEQHHLAVRVAHEIVEGKHQRWFFAVQSRQRCSIVAGGHYPRLWLCCWDHHFYRPLSIKVGDPTYRGIGDTAVSRRRRTTAQPVPLVAR